MAQEFIKECEKELLQGRTCNIQELRSHFSSKYPSACCKEVIEEDEEKIFIHCSECSADGNSVFCVPCFLKGNHDGHHVYIYKDAHGCCDCGDINEIKEEGCCQAHKHNNLECNQLIKEENDLFTKIFTKAGEKFAIYGEKDLKALIKWIISFNDFGDEVMDCIVSAVEPFITEELLRNEDKFYIIMKLVLSISKIKSATNVLFPKLIDSFKVLSHLYPKYDSLGFAIFKKRAFAKYAETRPNWLSFIEDLLEVSLEQFSNNSLYFESCVNRIQWFLNVKGNEDNKKKLSIMFAKYLGKIEDLCIIKRELNEKMNNHNYCGLKFNFLIDNIMYFAKKCAKYAELPDILDVLIEHIGNIESKCPAADGVASNCFLPLHAFVSMIIKHKGESCLQELIKYGKEKFGDVKKFANTLIEFPLRSISLIYYTEERKFVRNSEDEIRAIINNVIEIASQEYNYMHIFSLIQILSALLDKEEFVNNVINHFSVDRDEMRDALFHFLTCIIFDRYCLANDSYALIKADIFKNLLEKPLPIECLLDSYEKNGKIADLIRESCDKVPDNSYGFLAKNKSDKFETYYIPWFFIHKTTNMITNYSKHFKDSLLPTPASISNTDFNYLKLWEIFETDGFNTLINDAIQSDSLRIHLFALSVLVEEFKYNESSKSIKIDIEKLLLHSGPKKTLKEAIKSIGEAGNAALLAIGVKRFEQRQNDFEEKKKLRQQKKQEIMAQYQKKMNEFKDCDDILDGEEDDNKEEVICPVCQLKKDDIIVYPMTIKVGPDSSFNETLRINSCMHPMHLSCIKSIETCPLDRKRINGFMPKLIDVDEITPEISKEIHNQFDVYPSSSLIAMIFNELHVLLSRFDINKDAFNNYPVDMLRNIFLIYKFYMTNDCDDKVECSDFNKEMKKMFKNEKSFDDIFDILIPHVNDKLLCCRLTLLFKYYCLNERNPGKTNFEELLSLKNISKEFPDYEINQSYITPFKKSFDIKLPKLFIEYAIEPYNIEMSSYDISIISLLTGKMINIEVHEDCFYDVGICVAGDFAGAILVLTGNNLKILGTPYRNMYDEEDIGLHIGMVTYLREETIPNIIYNLLALF